MLGRIGSIAVYAREPLTKRTYRLFSLWTSRFTITITGFSIGHWGIAIFHQRLEKEQPHD